MSAIAPRFEAQIERSQPRKADYFRHETRYAANQAGQIDEWQMKQLCTYDKAFDAYVSAADFLRFHRCVENPVFFHKLGKIWFARNPERKSTAVQHFPINDHDDFLEVMNEEILAHASRKNWSAIDRIHTSIAHLIVARLAYRKWLEKEAQNG